MLNVIDSNVERVGNSHRARTNSSAAVDRLAKLGVGVTDIGETECRFRHTDTLHRLKHKFEAQLTIQEGRVVMKGNWVFSTKADPHTTNIAFVARWFRMMGYSTIRSVTYMNTYIDIGHTTIDVEYEPSTYQGPPWHARTGFCAPWCKCRKVI